MGITDLEDADFIERCTTDVTLTVSEECNAAYVVGWLKVKCADNGAFSAKEPLVIGDVKTLIETVSINLNLNLNRDSVHRS